MEVKLLHNAPPIYSIPKAITELSAASQKKKKEKEKKKKKKEFELQLFNKNFQWSANQESINQSPVHSPSEILFTCLTQPTPYFLFLFLFFIFILNYN